MWTDCPSGKQAHKGRPDAERHAQQMRQARMTRGQVRAYECRDCGFWHVGHVYGTSIRNARR